MKLIDCPDLESIALIALIRNGPDTLIALRSLGDLLGIENCTRELLRSPTVDIHHRFGSLRSRRGSFCFLFLSLEEAIGPSGVPLELHWGIPLAPC